MGRGISRRRRRAEHMPCRVKRSLRVFVLLLFLLSLCGLYEGNRYLLPAELYKPDRELLLLIEKNAARFGLSEELLQSVILVESKYDRLAVSRTGALGVMQLMPDTAEWISKESGLPAKDLRDSAQNVPLGAWYLDYLLAEYDGNLVLALAAYNGGRGNVDRWIEEYQWPADYAEIDSIPFPETREFVRNVLENRDRMVEENSAKKSEEQNAGGEAS